MKEFLFFIKENSVKKQSPDINLAKATFKEGMDRLQMAKGILLTQKPKYSLENAYESIREIIDSVLFIEGYKSFSHEASVSYLIEMGFSLSEAMAVDRLRKQRNGIKYYGEEVTKEDAKIALIIAKRTIKKILEKKSKLKEFK